MLQFCYNHAIVTDNITIAAKPQKINFVNGVAVSMYNFSSNAGVGLSLRLRLIID